MKDANDTMSAQLDRIECRLIQGATEFHLKVELMHRGRPGEEVHRSFMRIPNLGEEIEHDGVTFVVVRVAWLEEGSEPYIYAKEGV